MGSKRRGDQGRRVVRSSPETPAANTPVPQLGRSSPLRIRSSNQDAAACQRWGAAKDFDTFVGRPPRRR